MVAAQQAFVSPVGTMWTVKVDGRAISGNYQKQSDAISVARRWLQDNGGGELVIQGEDGKIRQKDTVYPGNDPRNTRG